MNGTASREWRLPTPDTASGKAGYRLAELTKRGIGFAAALSDSVSPWLSLGGRPASDRAALSRQGQRALWQLTLLEDVVCVPGFIEGLALSVKSVVTTVTAPERLKAALDDASDANKRLATWMELLQPGLLGRLGLLALKVLAFLVYLFGFIVVPSASRFLAAYLEYAVSKACILALQDIEAEGLLSPLGAQPLPWTTCVLCEMPVGSTVRDALPKFCFEAEEHSAAFLTAAHSEDLWWPSSTSPPQPSPLSSAWNGDSPKEESSSRNSRPSRLRPSSNGSVDRVSQLFNSKWAPTPYASRNPTPRNSLQGAGRPTPGAGEPAPGASTAGGNPQGGLHAVDKVLAALHSKPRHEGAADAGGEGRSSPTGESDMGPTTPPGDDAELLPAQLSEGELTSQPVLSPARSTEVFVDAKEVLTPVEVKKDIATPLEHQSYALEHSTSLMEQIGPGEDALNEDPPL